VKVVIFDMDDTLYDEASFVLSGLRAVADFMSQQWGIPERGALMSMQQTLARDGREAIFDATLKQYGHFSRKAVSQCLNRYRTHAPEIRLYPDARRALKRLRCYSLYVVTDGNPRVQRNKARALNLPLAVKQIIATWHHGRSHGKPSPHLLNRIAKREGALPHEVVYVGDDPNKDFVGIKPLGFRTIRIMRGRFQALRLQPAYEADRRIATLDEVTEELFKRLETTKRFT
jgi:putative hydrolase of the HAD superfamily